MPINNYDSKNQEQQILDDAVNVSNSASISSTDREVGGWFWNSILGKWLFPGVQQEKEFGQEVAMQREQNRWNSEQERMARLKEAGVNPLTAAAGLSGSGSAPSVGSPNTAVNSGAEGMSALGSVAADIGSTVLSSAQRRHLNSQSELFNAQARETNELLDFKKGQFAASIAKDLADSGLSKEQSQYWSIKNKYADDSERSDLALKGWSIKKAEKEIALLKDQHKLNLQEWEKNVHSIDEMTYRAEKARIEAELMKGIEAIYKKYGVDLTLPENAMLIEAHESGHLDVILEINGKGAYNSSYNLGKGQYTAENEFAFQLANARRNGENISDVAYGRVGSWADAVGRAAGILGAWVESVEDWFMPKDPQAEKARVIRNRMTDVITGLGSELGKDESKDIEINNLIYIFNNAMLLSDNELIDWYYKNLPK